MEVLHSTYILVNLSGKEGVLKPEILRFHPGMEVKTCQNKNEFKSNSMVSYFPILQNCAESFVFKVS